MLGQLISSLEVISAIPWPNLLLLFGLALFLDLLLGVQSLLGWVSGPDELFGRLNQFFIKKLDRTNRSNNERLVRGTVVFIVMVPTFYWIGSGLDMLAFSSQLGFIICALLLALIIRQRKFWAEMVEVLRKRSDQTTHTGNHKENSQFIIKALLGFSDNIITSALLFSVGGFSLILPYRFMRVALNQQAKTNISRPQSPFLKPFWFFAELASLPGTIMACLLLAVAHIFIPGTDLTAIRGIVSVRRQALLSRQLPLSVLGQGLGLSFQFETGTNIRWTGPKNGRAKHTNIDIRRTGLTILVACLLGFLAATMLLGYTLTAK